jgi:hypothetical protein
MDMAGDLEMELPEILASAVPRARESANDSGWTLLNRFRSMNHNLRAEALRCRSLILLA